MKGEKKMTNEQFQFVKCVAEHIKKYYPASDDVCFFIASQFALESNYGKSNLAKSSFNFCGMKRPYRRPHISQPVCLYAVYHSLNECVVDYVLWLSWNHIAVTYSLDKFILAFRNSGYCPEKDYIAKIQSIYQQFKIYQNGQK